MYRVLPKGSTSNVSPHVTVCGNVAPSGIKMSARRPPAFVNATSTEPLASPSSYRSALHSIESVTMSPMIDSSL